MQRLLGALALGIARACYEDAVRRVQQAEAARVPGKTALTEAVARHLHDLMAYKDEYEVARLYTDGSFEREGFFVPVVDAAVRYLQPARFDDLLTIETAIATGIARNAPVRP